MHYDVAIIGAGWAGFNAALRARDFGLKVVLIEKDHIGGTCLNRGCVPTKTLIQSAKIYSQTKRAKNFGIETSEVKVHFSDVMARKEKLVAQLRQGMNFLLKGIDILNAEAEIVSSHTVKAQDAQIETNYILIASGSRPMELAQMKFDGKKIISSDDIVDIQEIPRSLLIIGGGVIGCEFASLFSAFGTEVTIVEKMPQLLPGVDREIARKLENSYKKKGITVHTSTDATAVPLENFELVLLCIGRAIFTQQMGLERIGLKTEKGKIIVDEYLRTNAQNIFAAGDCTGKLMLAHFAAYQGNIAARNIAHPDDLIKADNTTIPSCIFTDPEIASVGLSEEDVRAAGIEVEVNKFDFLGSGMARILDETEGFIKVLVDKKNKKILGAYILGPRATELIVTFAVAISNNLTTFQLKDTVFAHPTLSECIREAVE